MKTCPNCRESFQDETLNFCLSCGSVLSSSVSDNPPPTVIMDAPRRTNPNYSEPGTFGTGAPMQSWQNQPPPMMQNQPFGSVPSVSGADQTLPTISLVLGILGLLLFCCYGGLPLGIGAIITGWLGMKNADSDPQKYGGRGLAIGGLVLGVVSLVGTLIMLMIGIAANL